MTDFEVLSCNMQENPGKNSSVDTVDAQEGNTLKLCYLCLSLVSLFTLHYTVPQEPQCARFRRALTCSPIV